MAQRQAALPPFVCIHGAGGGGWEWDLWKPVVKQEGAPIFTTSDLVPAPGGLEKTTFDDYAAQVRSWITGLGSANGRPVLVGASMGGVFALHAAQSLRPKAIVLVNSVPPSGVKMAKPRPPSDYPAVVKWANGPLAETRDAMPDSDEKTILWAWKKWRDESGQVMNTLARGVSVPKPTCPVLCVLGTADTDVSHATGLALAEWAGADVHIYRNMSHVGPLMSKGAEAVARAVCGWVRDLK